MIDEKRHGQLERALADAGGTHTLTDILDAISDGRMQSFAAGDTWAVTYIVETPRKRVLEVFLVIGDMAEAVRLHDEVATWAKAHGCTMLRTIARKGWMKWALPRGWTNKHTVYTKDL